MSQRNLFSIKGGKDKKKPSYFMKVWAEVNLHSAYDFWLALVLTFWKFEVHGTHAINPVQIFDLIIDRKLAFLILKDKTIWPFALQQLSWLAGLGLSFERMWHLAPSTHIKQLHPVCYRLSNDRLPHLVISWDSAVSMSLWMATSFLIVTDSI